MKLDLFAYPAPFAMNLTGLISVTGVKQKACQKTKKAGQACFFADFTA
jgi:hypothetical protein